jgi:hypothetical protein
LWINFLETIAFLGVDLDGSFFVIFRETTPWYHKIHKIPTGFWKIFSQFRIESRYTYQNYNSLKLGPWKKSDSFINLTEFSLAVMMKAKKF